jgi:hypothetical protein
MKRLIHSLKSQSIGVAALFVALGGTGYAAISIPRNSVGSRQLRNGAVTDVKLANKSIDPVKLNPTMIGASVRAWAAIMPSGRIAASSEPAHTVGWNQPNAPGVGIVGFAHPFPSVRDCFTLANVEGIAGVPAGAGVASATFTAVSPDPAKGGANGLQVLMYNVDGTPGTELPVLVAVLC